MVDKMFEEIIYFNFRLWVTIFKALSSRRSS